MLLFSQLTEADFGSTHDVSDGQEELCSWYVFSNVDRANLASPVEDVLEQVPMNRHELVEVIGGYKRMVQEFNRSREREIGLGFGQLGGGDCPDEVAENG
jgi:hypothetical protein